MEEDLDSFLIGPGAERPDPSAARRNAGIALAERGHFAEAIREFEAAIAMAPLDNLSKGYLGSCYFALGHEDEALEWMDCEEEVFCRPGFSDDRLNKDLSEYVRRHPSLTWEPSAKSTQGGWQSEELFRDGHPLTNHLRSEIARTLNEEFELGLDEEGGRGALKLVAWAVLLEPGGHQTLHLHRSGILSGVLYLHVPTGLRPPAGHLVFTQNLPWLPVPEPYRRVPPQSLGIESGSIVVFPSHYWHGTLPFTGEQKRLSIAFDLTAV